MQVKRQMKLLSESARTTQAFLKTAKDEQELQEENLPTSDPTTSYVPCFTNTVSTTLQANDRSDASKHPYPAQTNTSHQYKNTYRHREKFNETQRSPSRNYQQSSQPLTARRNMLRTPCKIQQQSTGNRDDGDSTNIQRKPSTTYDIPPRLSSSIYINVQVNNKRQHAIVDIGSAVTILGQPLLKKIYHKKFTYKQKSHKSAKFISVNIIGETQLEIKIQGFKILILADIATILVTDPLLGNGLISENYVIMNSPQQYITLTDK